MAASNPAVKVLKKAKKLIADPRHWTKGSLAKDANGLSTITDDRAVSFCSLGAIDRAGHLVDPYGDLFFPAVEFLKKGIGSDDRFVSAWNDDPNTTHTDVMVAFDKAIRLAKKNVS